MDVFGIAVDLVAFQAEAKMLNEFAIFILPQHDRLEPQHHAGILLGQCPGFQFVESGPWRLCDVRTQRQHTVNYLIPSTIELGDSYESPSDTVKRCLQSILRFPPLFEPTLDDSRLPTIMTVTSSTACPAAGAFPIRCLCSFSYDFALSSPDVRALIFDTAELQRHSVRALQGIPRPRNRRIEGLVEQYEAAANNTVLAAGMVLPCEAEGEASSRYGACMLVEQRGAGVFLCDLYFEKPTQILVGSKLRRKVSCQKTKATKAFEYCADVATVLDIGLSQKHKPG